MAIDKHNSLQFLMFGQRSYFEEFGDVDGVYVDRVPFELRVRLLRWTWPTRIRDHYFFQHAGRDVITREGWEAFVRWVGYAMDRQLGAEDDDPKEAAAVTQSTHPENRLTYFGLCVVEERFVRLRDIEALPFAMFWRESSMGSTMLASDDAETLVYLHDWVAFAERFIKTGQHRYSKA